MSSRLTEHYDALIVGGGHNGLTCAGYLARAGQKVLLLERRSRVGGLCAEYEFMPGYKAAMPNSPGSLEPKVVLDLELERHGLKFNHPDPSLSMPRLDGRSLMAWRDPVRTATQIEQFSKKDVEGYRRLFEDLNRFAERLGVSLFEPPPSLSEIGSRLTTPADEEAFGKLFLGSLQDLLDEYLECDVLKSAIAAISMTSNLVGPQTPGSAYLLMMRPFSLASSRVNAEHDPRRQNLRGSTGLPVGGMGSIVKAMEASLIASGGQIRTDAAVVEILCENGAVEGVRLSDDSVIRGRIVSSNLHPLTTLCSLLPEGVLPTELVHRLNTLSRRGSAFKIALALAELPHFAAAPAGLEREFAACQFRLAPDLDYMERAYDEAKRGEPSTEPIVLGLVPSIMDPSVAPPGKHLMSLNIFHAPTRLAHGDWEQQREVFGQRCIDLIARYIPRLRDILVDYRFLSPVDLENEFGLLDANIMHLDMMPRHMFGLRPLPGWSSYATSVKGLYLCGSGCWPGGTVSGVPGHNASQQILRDLRDKG